MARSISPRLQNLLENLAYIFSWLILSILAALTSFQVHATLIALALQLVNTPSLRPSGWSTQTIYGLSRLLWVIFGIFWIIWVMVTQEFLSEGKQLHALKKRIFWLFLIVGIPYLICTIILLLL